MNALAILLLGLTVSSVSFASPIAQCDSSSSSSKQQEECYVQNNGKPVVIVANSPVESSQNSQSSQIYSNKWRSGTYNLTPVSNCQQSSSGSSKGDLVVPVAPIASSSCSSSSGSSTSSGSSSSSDSSSDLKLAQKIADQAADENPIETLPQSNAPCKVEKKTEVENVGAETFVHQPGEIYINQPPTRLIINHAPFVIRPSPIVLNQGGRKITKEYTKTYLPSQVQVRPIIVRVVKPIEQNVFLSKPAQSGSCQTSVQNSIGSSSSSGSSGYSGSSLSQESGSSSSQSNQSEYYASEQSQSGQEQSSSVSQQGCNGNTIYQDAPIELKSDASSDYSSSYQQSSSSDDCGCTK